MIGVFVNVVLPVFIVAGLGFAIQRRLRPSPAALNQVALYVLVPCLVFTSLLEVDFRSRGPIQIGLFALLATVAVLAVSFVIMRLTGADRVTTSAFMLTTAFPNLGNYGLSVVLLAYGQEGLAIALVLLSVQSLYGTTLAIFLASSSNASIRSALRQVFRLPMIYAVTAAVTLNLAQVSVPTFVTSALALPAQAAIPLMLLVLGMQLAGIARIEQPATVAVAVLTRLILGTAIGYILTLALGIEGLTQEVLVVGSAMPTAVFTIVMATQFDARPRFVGDVVLVSTLVSIFTVTGVLTLLSGEFRLL